MSQKLYLNLLRLGCYAALFTVFFVFKGLLFPFITSKQIMFNILIEAMFVLWIAFIIKYPEYRPKRSFITYGLVAFFAMMTLSSIFGVDFNLSFWGDIERMLGVFHLLHFLGLYLIIITVFREWKDWKIFLIISVIVAVFESIYGLKIPNSYASIGNSAYVSGYLIFNIYFVLLLFFKEKNKGLRWVYLLALPIMYFQFRKSNTTGAYVGLGFSFMVMTFLYGVLSKNKKVKIATITACLALIITVVMVLGNRKSEIVQNTSFLKPIASIDIKKNTFQTRLISWKAAWKDFKQHPILGTGHGNFAVIFDRHFDPSFYEQTRGETYFDRAHNNVVDIASTSGTLGITAYLFIFLALAFYLMRGYYREDINIHEFILVSCLTIAYFVQNLAVFDSLVTYIGLMIVLGYVFWLDRESEDTIIDKSGAKIKQFMGYLSKDRDFENKEIYALAISGLILFIIMFQFNIKPYQMLVATIDGQRAWASGDVEQTIEDYKRALGYNTVLDRDSRTSLIRIFASDPNRLKKIPREKAEEILDYLIDLAKQNVEYNKEDSLNQMMLAQILNAAAEFNKGNQDKFAFYSDQAIDAINMSVAASPGRIPIYFQKAQLYITRGDKDNALKTLEEAASLSETYYDSFCHLGRTEIFYGEKEDDNDLMARGYGNIDKCLDKGGASIIVPAGQVRKYINHYVEAEDWTRVIQLFRRLTVLEKKNAENWVKLARLYKNQGEAEKAREAADKAIEIDPGMRQYADEFINGL